MTSNIDERRARALCKLKCSLLVCTQGNCSFWYDWIDEAKAIREADKVDTPYEHKVLVKRLRSPINRPQDCVTQRREAADYIDQLELDIKERDSRIATLEKYAFKLEAEIADTAAKLD